MEVADIPQAWNAAMHDLLGVEVTEDRLGCLQDIHWFDGAWGYFPTYTLGAMTAAQLFAAASAANGAIRPRPHGGGTSPPLMAWLRENVHELGSSLPGDEIIATGDR